MLADPELDPELNHRDSLELPREKRARAGVAARRIAEMKPKPAERVVEKAKAFSGKAKAALVGVVGGCFGGDADSTAESWEEKEGLIFG